jgi:hypothetical protein
LSRRLWTRLLAGAFACLLLASLPAPVKANAANLVLFSSMSETTTVDLAEATLTFRVQLATRSIDVGAQVYLHRASPNPAWVFVNGVDPPGSTNAKVYPLYHGLDNTIALISNLPEGTYDNYRLILFDAPDGKSIDYGRVAYDTANDPAWQKLPVRFKIESSEVRVRAPQLIIDPNPRIEATGSGDYSVAIAAKVRVPDGYQTSQNMLWAMAHGPTGTDQVPVRLSDAVAAGVPGNRYLVASIEFDFKDVKAGIWDV